ncbi:hypothetical protein HanPI659440_Chr02g0040171 [Helianthus annuus]|nr:hypothetical protein HanPI659440_Chr02g0040171 [Helianthus annuus]
MQFSKSSSPPPPPPLSTATKRSFPKIDYLRLEKDFHLFIFLNIYLPNTQIVDYLIIVISSNIIKSKQYLSTSRFVTVNYLILIIQNA